MKKFIALVLSLCIASSLTLTCFAAPVHMEQLQTMQDVYEAVEILEEDGIPVNTYWVNVAKKLIDEKTGKGRWPWVIISRESGIN